MDNQTKTLTEYSKVPILNRFSTKRDCSLLRRTGNCIFDRRIVERRSWGLRAIRLRLRSLFLWHGHRSVITTAQNDGRVTTPLGFGFSLQVGFAGLRIRAS